MSSLLRRATSQDRRSETSTFLNTDLASIGMFGATYTGVRALMRPGGQGMRTI